jgi:hypothetical protein
MHHRTEDETKRNAHLPKNSTHGFANPKGAIDELTSFGFPP